MRREASCSCNDAGARKASRREDSAFARRDACSTCGADVAVAAAAEKRNGAPNLAVVRPFSCVVMVDREQARVRLIRLAGRAASAARSLSRIRLSPKTQTDVRWHIHRTCQGRRVRNERNWGRLQQSRIIRATHCPADNGQLTKQSLRRRRRLLHRGRRATLHPNAVERCHHASNFAHSVVRHEDPQSQSRFGRLP